MAKEKQVLCNRRSHASPLSTNTTSTERTIGVTPTFTHHTQPTVLFLYLS